MSVYFVTFTPNEDGYQCAHDNVFPYALIVHILYTDLFQQNQEHERKYLERKRTMRGVLMVRQDLVPILPQLSVFHWPYVRLLDIVKPTGRYHTVLALRSPVVNLPDHSHLLLEYILFIGA